MKSIIQEIISQLEPSLVKELKESAVKYKVSIEILLTELLQQSTHSLASLERMNPKRRTQILKMPETKYELGRIFWKACWHPVAA